MTCKSVQHVDKAIYFLGNADPPRRAHYYWGQDLAEVTRGEPMPRFLLELRAKVIEALQLPDKVRVTVKVPGWACTAVGDEVAGCTVLDGVEAVVAAGVDVVVDFTVADAARANLPVLAAAGVHAVELSDAEKDGEAHVPRWRVLRSFGHAPRRLPRRR